MMKINHYVALSLSLIVLMGCRQARTSSGPIREALIEQGSRVVPNIAELEAKFDTVSFIANFGHPYATQEWHTVFYIDNWFQCVYAHDVRISDGKISLIGEPRLHINEITKIDGRSFHFGEQRILRGEELSGFIESGFDLERIGLSSTEGREPPRDNPMDYWHNLYPTR